MTFGQKLAYHIAPLFMRVVVGVTLLWAGLGRLIPEDYPVSPQNARALVDMGAVEEAKVRGFLDADPSASPVSEEVTNGDPSSDNDDAGEDTDPGSTGGADPDSDNATDGGSASTLDHAITLAQDADANDDLPVLKRLYEVAVVVSHAANPGPNDAGETPSPILPSFMGDKSTPKYLGWAAAVAEIFAGGFLLIGFMARLSGLTAACVMAMAMWLTNIGPAVMGHVPAKFGFLPFPESQSFFDTPFYVELGWQLALLAGGLTLLFSGAGALSLDRILFGSSKNDDFDED